MKANRKQWAGLGWNGKYKKPAINMIMIVRKSSGPSANSVLLIKKSGTSNPIASRHPCPDVVPLSLSAMSHVPE